MPLALKDISVKAMAKRKRGVKFSFDKSVPDNGCSVHKHGFSINLRLGKQLVKIDKWYPSSQKCHVLGFKNNETQDLSVRKYYCPKCGSHKP